MSRVSRISSTEDFVTEVRREALRDWRWRRHRSMIFAIVILALGLVELGSHLPPVLPTLVRLL